MISEGNNVLADSEKDLGFTVTWKSEFYICLWKTNNAEKLEQNYDKWLEKVPKENIPNTDDSRILRTVSVALWDFTYKSKVIKHSIWS